MSAIDHSKAFATLRRLEQAARAAESVEVIARPATAAAKLLGWSRLGQITESLCEIENLAGRTLFLARRYLRATDNHHSSLVVGLWETAPIIAITRRGDSGFRWRDVFGVPVVCDNSADSDWFAAPESASQILARMRSLGRSWIVRETGAVSIDERAVPAIRGARTQAIIDRLQLFRCPRAQLLWGPPGGGKTVAARQVLAECSQMSVTLSPRAATSDTIWDQLDELRPDGILIDDVDSIADLDSLLDRLERARSYARVILATANTVSDLRGALLRPGRVSDDEPVRFDELDAATARAITSHVPGDVPSDLLAAYLAELEARALAGVLRSDGSDVAELRQRMVAAGDR